MANQGIGHKWISTVGPITVINLAKRRDRRAEMATNLKRIGLSYDADGVTLLEAIAPSDPGDFPTIGARGCFLSHLKTLKTAQAAKLGAVTILEDDLDFVRDIDNTMQAALDALDGHDWDILYGAYDPAPEGAEIAPCLIHIDPQTPIGCSHFLCLRGHVLPVIIPYLETILARPPGHPDGGPMHVDGAYAHFRADHPQLTTLAVVPALGHQRASRSDVHELRWWDKVPLIREMVSQARKVKRLLG